MKLERHIPMKPITCDYRGAEWIGKLIGLKFNWIEEFVRVVDGGISGRQQPGQIPQYG